MQFPRPDPLKGAQDSRSGWTPAAGFDVGLAPFQLSCLLCFANNPILPPPSPQVTREVAVTGAGTETLGCPAPLAAGRGGRKSCSRTPTRQDWGWRVDPTGRRGASRGEGQSSLGRFKQAPDRQFPSRRPGNTPPQFAAPLPASSSLQASPLPQPYLVQQGLVVASPPRAGGVGLHGRGAWAASGRRGNRAGPGLSCSTADRARLRLQHRGQRPPPPPPGGVPLGRPGPARFGSVRLGSIRHGPVRLGPVSIPRRTAERCLAPRRRRARPARRVPLPGGGGRGE